MVPLALLFDLFSELVLGVCYMNIFINYKIQFTLIMYVVNFHELHEYKPIHSSLNVFIYSIN